MNGSPTDPVLVQQIRDLRYIDGLTCPEVALSLGVNVHTVRHLAPGRPGKVPNDLTRAIFQSSGLTACSVARKMGWMCRDGRGHMKGDGSRLRRTLGLIVESGGSHPNRTRSFRRLIDAEVAGLIAEACGHHSWEAIPDESAVAA